MHDDVYQMYLEEIKAIKPCTAGEEKELLERLRQGDESARTRLLEGTLQYITELARDYGGRGLPLGDLVQEANMALMTAVAQAAAEDSSEPRSGDAGDGLTVFRALVRARVEEALEAALEGQKLSEQVSGELLARVNVLQEVSRRMAEELGREATVEELARKMKMTEDEIRDIMKLTLDAMSVSPDAEV
ncbi:MAG: sigma-70 domain-containing protein [Eubacteriales bacterium]|nr:sigma-70 domain-containing protein [Eubacteriales bacterium]